MNSATELERRRPPHWTASATLSNQTGLREVVYSGRTTLSVTVITGRDHLSSRWAVLLKHRRAKLFSNTGRVHGRQNTSPVNRGREYWQCVPTLSYFVLSGVWRTDVGRQTDRISTTKTAPALRRAVKTKRAAALGTVLRRSIWYRGGPMRVVLLWQNKQRDQRHQHGSANGFDTWRRNTTNQFRNMFLMVRSDSIN